MALAILLVAGCRAEVDDDIMGGHGTYPDAGPPPFPTEWTELPPCDPDPNGFDDPVIDAASGLVFMDLASPWQPVGEPKHVRIEIRQVGTGDLDSAATGEVVLAMGPGATVVSQTPIAAGIVDAVMRFDQQGLHDISATLTVGGRTGTAQVFAYESQLPIWNMEVDEAELEAIADDPKSGVKIPMMVTIDGDLYTGTVRLHGGSSRYYRKPSWRLDFDSGQKLPDGSNHIVLRAEWADKTMLRNYLGLEVFRNMTWLPTPGAEIVHFRINGRYYGAMWHVDRIDADFLRRHDMPADGSLYEADPSGSDYYLPGGNLTPLASMEAYRETYQHHKGPHDYDDLLELIEIVLGADEGPFREVIEKIVKVDDYLVYLAVLAVIQDQDHVRKNYYLHRDANGPDDRWRVLPWDLDLSFGHLWTEQNDILDEQIFTDGSLYVGQRVPQHDYFNELMNRLWSVPELDARFRDYVSYISGEVYDTDFLDQRIDNVLCRAAPELLSDEKKRATNQEYLGRVDEIRTFAGVRRAFVESVLE